MAETKGMMESLQLKPIKRAKIHCARKLFNEMSTSKAKYHNVDSYQHLLDVMKSIRSRNMSCVQEIDTTPFFKIGGDADG